MPTRGKWRKKIMGGGKVVHKQKACLFYVIGRTALWEKKGVTRCPLWKVGKKGLGKQRRSDLPKLPRGKGKAETYLGMAGAKEIKKQNAAETGLVEREGGRDILNEGAGRLNVNTGKTRAT